MVRGLQVVVLSFEFHQNWLSGFGAVGVEICPSPLTWPLAYTVQAVIMYTIPINTLMSTLSLNNQLCADDTQLFLSYFINPTSTPALLTYKMPVSDVITLFHSTHPTSIHPLITIRMPFSKSLPGWLPIS